MIVFDSDTLNISFSIWKVKCIIFANTSINYLHVIKFQHPDPSIHICIAKSLEIVDPVAHSEDIEKHYREAGQLGSSQAALTLWEQKYNKVITQINHS